MDLSHTWSVLRMRGPEAREVLSKICALDTHPRAFGYRIDGQGGGA